MGELGDRISTVAGGKPDPGHRLVTGPSILSFSTRRTGRTHPQAEQGAAAVLVDDDIH